MPTYHSLHLGLNIVNPEHYPRLRPLRAAVGDAHDWARMARDFLGYQQQEVLTDEQVTTKDLLDRLSALAAEMQAGDALLLTYSGHGGQVEDALSPNTGDEDKDQTWCLYDRQLLDDELHKAFSSFQAGVRISVIADCCHSGTSIKDVGRAPSDPGQRQQEIEAEADLENAGFMARRLSREQSASIFTNFYELYRGILGEKKSGKRVVRASIQLFAACQDNQITYDGPLNGIFTDAFKTLIHSGEWNSLSNSGALIGRLRRFFQYPVPNYLAYGEGLPVFDSGFPLLANLSDHIGAQSARATTIQIDNPAAVATPANPEPARPVSGEYKIRLELETGLLNPATVSSLCPVLPARLEVHADGHSALVYFPAIQFSSVWEPVHHIAAAADRQNIALSVEPVAGAATPLQPGPEEARDAEDASTYLPYWPPATELAEPLPGWHLDEAHTQLAAARDFVWEKMRNGEITENVRIAHLDTGWYPTHPGFVFNPNIRRDLTRSFVDKEKGINQAAIDLQYKKSEQQGHGSGTLGVLACWALDPQLTGGQNLGYLGATPFAEVVPIRIADSVLIFDVNNFSDGLEYAMEIGCDVVSMSMGGKPGRRMARVINRAYEKGITIVTAAGNNMAKGAASVGPKIVVWPAHYQRVLAACGACHNQVPYDFDAQTRYGNGARTSNYRYMQGNWGPAAAMTKALAAYTPNISWVVRDEAQAIGKRGGGTSAATPQIAAAAAIWIACHREELRRRGYAGNWKQVEAVRRALFATADKSFPESQKYYGNGILKAMNAIEYGVPDISDDMIAPKADSSLFGLQEALKLFFHRRRSAAATPGPALQQSLELELQHLLIDHPELAERDNVGQDDLAALLAGNGVSPALRAALAG